LGLGDRDHVLRSEAFARRFQQGVEPRWVQIQSGRELIVEA
jgi:hypothetical protein